MEKIIAVTKDSPLNILALAKSLKESGFSKESGKYYSTDDDEVYFEIYPEGEKGHNDGRGICLDDDGWQFTLYFGSGHLHVEIIDDSPSGVLAAARNIVKVAKHIAERKIFWYEMYSPIVARYGYGLGAGDPIEYLKKLGARFDSEHSKEKPVNDEAVKLKGKAAYMLFGDEQTSYIELTAQ